MNPPTRPRTKRLTTQELQVIKQAFDIVDKQHDKLLDIYYRINIPVADDIALDALHRSLNLTRTMLVNILQRYNVRL